MIRIKHKTTGEVLLEVDSDTLRYADLRDANLQGADLRGADLEGANLRGTDLRNVDLEFANLQGADLRGASLRGADLWRADLRSANFYGANLEGVIGIWLGASTTKRGDRKMSERKFFDDTTYAEPAVFLDHATNRLWHGPVNPDGNLHWGKLEGFSNADGSPIFVYCASELPDGDYIRIETKPPKSRDELFQDLLDAIDNCVGVCIDEEWRKVNEARERLR